MPCGISKKYNKIQCAYVGYLLKAYHKTSVYACCTTTATHMSIDFVVGHIYEFIIVRSG